MIQDIATDGVIQTAEREHKAFDIDLARWERGKPHGISGCFRVRNEAEWLYESVKSHMPWLDEAVLLLQPGNDETFNEACRLLHDFPGKIRLGCYPFDVVGIGTKEHFDLPETSVRHMVHMSNFALSLCRYSWICKVEADVLCLSSFEKIRDLVDDNPSTPKYYGRCGMNLAGLRCDRFSKEKPRTHGWDEAVFPNHPRYHFRRADKWEAVNMWEYRNEMVPCGMSFLHTKRCKAVHQRIQIQETWLPYDREHVQPVLEEYDATVNKYCGPDGICPDVIFEEVEGLHAHNRHYSYKA